MDSSFIHKVNLPLQLIKTADGIKPDSRSTCIMTYLGYKLEDELGKGEISQVRKARWIKKNMEVAIKFIPKFKACSEYYERYLPLELQALLVTRSHPFIVDLLSVYEGPRAFYLIFEYVPMGNLLNYVNRRKFLGEIESRKFFKQLIDAVDYCHRQRIAHRDIKLDNILLDKSFNIRLCVSDLISWGIDFGFAARLSDTNACSGDCGSILYVAPEVLVYSNQIYDGTKADIWSMGICLYGMLCGKLPYSIPDRDIFLNCVNERLKFTRILSKNCCRLLQGLLQCNPNLRPQLYEIRRSPWLSEPMNALAEWCSSENLLRPENEVVNGGQSNGATEKTTIKSSQKGFEAEVRARFISGALRAAALNERFGSLTEVLLHEDKLLTVGGATESIILDQEALKLEADKGTVELRSYLTGMRLKTTSTFWQNFILNRKQNVDRELGLLHNTASGMMASKAKEMMVEDREQESVLGKNLRFKAAVLKVQRERLEKWRLVCRQMLACAATFKKQLQENVGKESGTN